VRPGGLIACAIVTDIDPFDTGTGDAGPSPEPVTVDGRMYVSRPTAVRVRTRRIVIERRRRVLAAGAPAARVALSEERDVIELDRLGVSQLEREGAEAGLSPQPARVIAPTSYHVGSVVVMLRA
jgi:hypothetical protein